ncbi:hypothetical protein BVRB_2g030530 isoform A [Beta vulgaris subsp. vulgaris]|nr:hypothetical protein BVRB_2g030530 isoform A [Beta vulgaris subsp. vulgaris]
MLCSLIFGSLFLWWCSFVNEASVLLVLSSDYDGDNLLPLTAANIMFGLLLTLSSLHWKPFIFSFMSCMFVISYPRIH